MHTIEFLIGKTLGSIERTNFPNSPEALIFKTPTHTLTMQHIRDCCEVVYLEDVCGDLDDLIGTPIVSAYCEESKERIEESDAPLDQSFTWTFYRISTIKGTVTLRWLGTSNGYYSESVDITISEIAGNGSNPGSTPTTG